MKMVGNWCRVVAQISVISTAQSEQLKLDVFTNRIVHKELAMNIVGHSMLYVELLFIVIISVNTLPSQALNGSFSCSLFLPLEGTK